MRITAGKLKDMEVFSPKGQKTRPTSAKVREAVMSMLAEWLHDSVVVDYFAGSGVLGFEAVSRGAKDILFLENDSSACNLLKKNRQNALTRLESFDPSCLKIKKQDLLKLKKSFEKPFHEPDVVFSDPPYHMVVAWFEYYLSCKLNLPCHGGVLVLEHSANDSQRLQKIISTDPIFELYKLKKYGDTAIIIARRGKKDEQT